MESFWEFLLLLIRQFAGGPGPIENNFVRFGLAAVFWLVLLVIAWSRQKNQNLPREKLLIWGFGLALMRELIMLGLTTGKISGFLHSGGDDIYYYPLEHGLTMTAVTVVAGAFLQYALKDQKLSQRFIQIGLSVTFLALLITYLTWPKVAFSSPAVHFNETWESDIFHGLSIALIASVIFLLARKHSWLNVVVSIAFGFLFLSEFLFLLGDFFNNTMNHIFCPISNALHIFAIPVFGFVYLNEMSIEKKMAEKNLEDYRGHLEDQVHERTSMLSAQNEIAYSLSQSLDLETILDMALDKVLSVLSLEVGLLFLLERERENISLGSYRGCLSSEDLNICIKEGCPYERLSKDAIDRQTIIQVSTVETLSGFFHIEREHIQLLISVPLVSKNKIVGALTLGSKKASPLDQTTLELLTAICNQIGMAVENAFLYQDAEMWAEKLSTLHQASVNLVSTLDEKQLNEEIATQSSRLTGRPMACVIYWENRCERLEILSSIGIRPEIRDLLSDNPKACALLEELCQTKESIVINDIKSDDRIPDSWKTGLNIGSLLCTPIWGADQPVEFLFIMDQRKNRTWPARDVELVESFISQAAVALENANLYKQLEWAATLEERQRIAANMHDGLAQIISLLGLKIDHVAELIPSKTSAEIADALRDTRKTVVQALVEARKSISSLQAKPQPQKSLEEILTAQVEAWSNEWSDWDAMEIKTAFSFLEPLFLPSDQVAQIIPIIQEAVVNACKHSGATQIQVKGKQLNSQVDIVVEDDGKGFDVDTLGEQEGSHFGLKIMHARAARFGGKLHVDSRPDCGTKITLSWMTACDAEREKEEPFRNAVRSKPPVTEGETYV